jgi:hypothetical protein
MTVNPVSNRSVGRMREEESLLVSAGKREAVIQMDSSPSLMTGLDDSAKNSTARLWRRSGKLG